jgi:hypothetical protein
MGVILLTGVLVIPVTAELNFTWTDNGKTLINNGTYWIQWDPAGNHIVGDPLVINATTNLSVGSIGYYEFYAPAGGCHLKVCNRSVWGTVGETRINSGDRSGLNEFSITINTTGFQSNYYYFWFSLNSSTIPAETDAFNNRFMVFPDVLLFSDEILPTVKFNSQSYPDDSGTRYWMAFPAYVNYTRPCYQLTGWTNLPLDQRVSYSYFFPVDTGDTTNVDPIRINVQDQIAAGIVVPGDQPGINKLVIQMNTSKAIAGSGNIIVWNPRYNVSDPKDSIATSINLWYPVSGYANVSGICSVQKNEIYPVNSTLTHLTKPTDSSLSWLSIIGAFFVIVWYVLIKTRDGEL